MACRDNFLKTLTIEGEYDRTNNYRKYNNPVIFVRLPSPKPSSSRPVLYRSLRRENSAPPTMGRRKLNSVPDLVPTNFSTNNHAYDFGNSNKQLLVDHDGAFLGIQKRAVQFLSFLWLPFCFTGINAVCYAIDPTAAALMMASSTFLLHQMGVAGRHITLIVIIAGSAALLLHGSDSVYIMAVHTLYYCAVSLQARSADTTNGYRSKRGYTKRAR